MQYLDSIEEEIGVKRPLKALHPLLDQCGFSRAKPLSYIRTVNGVSHQCDVQPSTWDDSCYLLAYVKTAPDPSDIELGGRVSPGGVDYLDHSFSSKMFESSDLCRKIFDSVVLPWFSYFDSSEQFLSVVENIDKGKDRHACIGDLIPQTIQMLSEIGYSAKVEENAVVFFKENAAIWHLVQMEIISNGVFLAVRVASWMPDFQISDKWQADSSPDQFDSLMIINGGFINGGLLENTLTSPLNISGERQKAETDKKLSGLLNKCASEFFSSQNTRSDLIGSVHEQYKRSSYFAEVLGA